MTFPSTHPSDFCWAAGIENTFIPQSRFGMRALDEYALTQHYQQWKTDLDLVAETGVRALRWGIPWYKVQPAPNRWDWAWVDQVLDYMVNGKGIAPILDLMHYGTPLWLENSFVNHQYPERVAEYASAVVERYASLVRYITPLNEPTVNADFCGRRGEWPPYLEGDDGYVKLCLAIAKGMVLTSQAIRAANPQLVQVQVEALWKFTTQSAQHAEQVALQNEHQYLVFDLTTGRVNPQHPLYSYLQGFGASEALLDWFQHNKASYDVFGANFYPWSYGEYVPRADGALRRVRRKTSGWAIAEVVEDAYRRYQLPVMVTETSATEKMAGRAQWMDETIAAVFDLRKKGVPVVGYTWFPMITMIDWAYRRGRKPVSDYLLNLGLFEASFDANGLLKRSPTEYVARYRSYTTQTVPPVGPQLNK